MEATASVENDTMTIEMADMRREPTYVLYFTISQGQRAMQFNRGREGVNRVVRITNFDLRSKIKDHSK